jgi:hypothetical protein
MTNGTADLVQVRLALQRLKRGTLLIIAESAAELVEPSKLKALLGDIIDIEALAAAPAMAPPLLEDVRTLWAKSGRRLLRELSGSRMELHGAVQRNGCLHGHVRPSAGQVYSRCRDGAASTGTGGV